MLIKDSAKGLIWVSTGSLFGVRYMLMFFLKYPLLIKMNVKKISYFRIDFQVDIKTPVVKNIYSLFSVPLSFLVMIVFTKYANCHQGIN